MKLNHDSVTFTPEELERDRLTRYSDKSSHATGKKTYTLSEYAERLAELLADRWCVDWDSLGPDERSGRHMEAHVILCEIGLDKILDN